MGLFSKLFGSSPDSDIQRDLENLYIPLFQSTMGISYSKSESMVKDLLRMVIEESKKEKTSDLPSGDFLLENEMKLPMVKNMLDEKRKEGVRDEDIRWWWNLHDYEKRMMNKWDDVNKLVLFKKYISEDKLSDEESGKSVKKYFPVYCDSPDTTNTSDDDRPIPVELKDRVNKYIEKRFTSDRDNYRKDLNHSSSFNSLIRKEILKGNL